MVVFEQRCSSLGKNGCIWEQWLYSGKGGFRRAKWCIFVAKGGCVRKKWLNLGKSGCVRAKWLYSVKCFFRAKVVVFLKSGCIRAKLVLFGQK